MKYTPLLDVAIRHDYYGDGRSSDFELEATDRTERLIRNHRLTVQTRPDGIQLAAPLDGGGNYFIALADDTTFVWNLRVKNADVALITDPDSLNVKRVTRYRNSASSTSGPLAGVEHPAPDQVPADVVATVEVTFGSIGPLAEAVPREFAVHFDPAATWWAYYLVTDIPDGSGTFSLVDTAAEPLAFGASNARDLVANPDAADEVAAQLAIRHPSLRRLRFRSDQPVTARREPRRNIELRLDGQRVAGPLANPKPSSRSALSVTVDGLVEEHVALSHIMRYPDRPPANQGV